MSVDPPTPLPTRPSDAERDRVARRLGDEAAAGRLSLDTFSRRIEHVYEAPSRAELGELCRDLPAGGRARNVLVEAVRRLSALTGELQAAWREPRLSRLPLPRSGVDRMTIGRSPDCDYVVAEATVSRMHAELREHDGEWLLLDLRSRNGTWLNGLAVREPAQVRPGDHVSFGGASFRVTRP